MLIPYFIGGHLGRDKTYNKIAERFYWKSLWKDVTSFLKNCEVCQTTNDAKFVKEAAPLHPIPVKPEVWRQVKHCTRRTRTRPTLYVFPMTLSHLKMLINASMPGAIVN